MKVMSCMRRRCFAFVTLFCCTTAARAQQTTDFRLRYVDLRVTLLEQTHSLSGVVRLAIARTNADAAALAIAFSDSMVVDSVRGGKPLARVATTRAAGFIQIAGAPLRNICSGARSKASCPVEIFYHGTPSRRAMGISDHNGTMRAASFGIPNSAREWWPTLDDPMQKFDSADIRITAPSGLRAGSNGRLVDRHDNGDGTVTTHWHESSPIYSDVVSIAVADYVERHASYHSITGRDVPLTFFEFPEDTSKADVDFTIVPKVLSFLESWLGPYPFANEKYGIAEMTRQSFREHQTLPSLGAGLISGNHDVDQVIAHEAAHQWFGNSLTVTRWQDVWLNEGFAEFMAWQFIRSSRGDSAYQALVSDAEKQTYQGTLAHADAGGFASMFGALTFQKGPLVLVRLEEKIGDRAMRAALKAYVTTNAYRHGSLQAFQAQAEKASGMKLNDFFEQWVNH